MINVKELINEYTKDLNPKSVLDLGCGKGRISLRFAKKGEKVTGIDKISNEISDENFKFILKDIKDFNFEEEYDLIISSLILHFLKKDEAKNIIEKTKQNTSKEGFNFLICISQEDDLSRKKPENFYPDSNFLKEIYSDWKIIKFDEGFTDIEEHDNSGPHKHHLIFLLIQKL